MKNWLGAPDSLAKPPTADSDSTVRVWYTHQNFGEVNCGCCMGVLDMMLDLLDLVDTGRLSSATSEIVVICSLERRYV